MDVEWTETLEVWGTPYRILSSSSCRNKVVFFCMKDVEGTEIDCPKEWAGS